MKKITLTTLIIFGLFQLVEAQTRLYTKLSKYSIARTKEFDQIPQQRQDQLKEIGDWIVTNKLKNEKVMLTIICTSNSRRSHITQIWAKTAAEYYGIDSLETFSGGTEATAFNPRAIAALNRAGFQIAQLNNGTENNPKYSASIGQDMSGYLMYSKKYNDKQNPQTSFGAIMVCSEADKSCPVIPGAEARFSLPYDDPKFYDNTPSEADKYDERVKQISREMLFLMDYSKKQLILKFESSKKL